MPAKIHIERMMYRSSIAVSGESAASYCLVKLIPSGDVQGQVSKALGLNLALVLDVSGSMYEEDGTGVSRLVRVQKAAKSAIAKLKPDDSIAIVAFAHNAQVVLPPTKCSDKAKIEQTIDNIDRFDVDPGGTVMDQGMQMALEAVEKSGGGGKLSQLVVLTDGETSGEQVCRELAKKAAEKKVRLTMIGVGTEWNSSLIKDLASLSVGNWHYIDVNNAEATLEVFKEEFETLAAAGFKDVELHLRPVKDIKVKRIRQVMPEIKEVTTTEPEERHLVGQLGTMERDKTSRFILDMTLPKKPDGKFAIAQLEVTFDSGSGKRESSGMIPLEVTYASQQGYINAEVARHIDEVQLFEMNKVLQTAIAQDDSAKVKEVAQQIEKKGEVMGPRAAKKTMLAKQVLAEMNASGRVSKKTQLAVDDAARMATE